MPLETRQRWSREERYKQLISRAWQIIKCEGTDALTLGHLAESAAVSKPVVYSHFKTRQALLGALYLAFVEKQNDMIDRALFTSDDTLDDKAQIIASAHIDCILAQGREIPGLEAALLGSPELESLRLNAEEAYIEKCRLALAPFHRAGGLKKVTLCAIFGAANGLAYYVSSGKLARDEAQQELCLTIMAMVRR